MLNGEKVTLRALERDDLRRMWELEQNLDLVFWSQPDWLPKPFAAYEREFDKHLEERDRFQFVIVADGKVIGGIGLMNVRRHAQAAYFGMGIFDPDYVGKGYGREAVNLLVQYAFHMQNFRRLACEVFANNERAIRAYRACGFIEEARMREHSLVNGEIVDLLSMGLLRDEWQAARRGVVAPDRR